MENVVPRLESCGSRIAKVEDDMDVRLSDHDKVLQELFQEQDEFPVDITLVWTGFPGTTRSRTSSMWTELWSVMGPGDHQEQDEFHMDITLICTGPRRPPGAGRVPCGQNSDLYWAPGTTRSRTSSIWTELWSVLGPGDHQEQDEFHMDRTLICTGPRRPPGAGRVPCGQNSDLYWAPGTTRSRTSNRCCNNCHISKTCM